MEKKKFHDMSESSNTLYNPKNKETWTKELSVFRTIQVKSSEHMRNLSVILFTSILMHFFFFTPINI